jgi:hypothetical protein
LYLTIVPASSSGAIVRGAFSKFRPANVSDKPEQEYPGLKFTCCNVHGLHPQAKPGNQIRRFFGQKRHKIGVPATAQQMKLEGQLKQMAIGVGNVRIQIFLSIRFGLNIRASEKITPTEFSKSFFKTWVSSFWP